MTDGRSKQGGKGQEKGGKGDNIAMWCQNGGNKNLCAIDEDESETTEETPNNGGVSTVVFFWKRVKMSSDRR